jgi:hypothetical protein
MLNVHSFSFLQPSNRRTRAEHRLNEDIEQRVKWSRDKANTVQLTAKNLPRLDEDERLSPVLTHLATSFLSGLDSSNYAGPTEGDGTVVTAEMVDDIAKRHFPLCMRHLYEKLKGDHHLKHFARLQLGLFLKVSRSVLVGVRRIWMRWASARKGKRFRLREDGCWMKKRERWRREELIHLGNRFTARW